MFTPKDAVGRVFWTKATCEYLGTGAAWRREALGNPKWPEGPGARTETVRPKDWGNLGGLTETRRQARHR